MIASFKGILMTEMTIWHYTFHWTRLLCTIENVDKRNKTSVLDGDNNKEPSRFTTINSIPLQSVTQQKYLGVVLTAELKRDEHITNITSRSSSFA